MRLIWRGHDLGTLEEADAKALADRMVILDRAGAVYDTVSFFQFNYEDEPELFFEMAITGQFEGMCLGDFVEEMVRDIIEGLDLYGDDYTVPEDCGMKVVA